MPSIEIGDPAPAFELTDQSGSVHSLKAYAGRRVVLWFFPKANTPGCTQEGREFTSLASEFSKAGAVVLGASPDAVSTQARFAAKCSISVPLLSDPGAKVARAYGAYGKKKFMGRESQGILRSTFLIGPDGRLERAWRGVKVDGHAREVLEALRGLGRR